MNNSINLSVFRKIVQLGAFIFFVYGGLITSRKSFPRSYNRRLHGFNPRSTCGNSIWHNYWP